MSKNNLSSHPVPRRGRERLLFPTGPVTTNSRTLTAEAVFWNNFFKDTQTLQLDSKQSAIYLSLVLVLMASGATIAHANHQSQSLALADSGSHDQNLAIAKAPHASAIMPPFAQPDDHQAAIDASNLAFNAFEKFTQDVMHPRLYPNTPQVIVDTVAEIYDIEPPESGMSGIGQQLTEAMIKVNRPLAEIITMNLLTGRNIAYDHEQGCWVNVVEHTKHSGNRKTVIAKKIPLTETQVQEALKPYNQLLFWSNAIISDSNSDQVNSVQEAATKAVATVMEESKNANATIEAENQQGSTDPLSLVFEDLMKKACGFDMVDANPLGCNGDILSTEYVIRVIAENYNANSLGPGINPDLVDFIADSVRAYRTAKGLYEIYDLVAVNENGETQHIGHEYHELTIEEKITKVEELVAKAKEFGVPVQIEYGPGHVLNHCPPGVLCIKVDLDAPTMPLIDFVPTGQENNGWIQWFGGLNLNRLKNLNVDESFSIADYPDAMATSQSEFNTVNSAAVDNLRPGGHHTIISNPKLSGQFEELFSRFIQAQGVARGGAHIYKDDATGVTTLIFDDGSQITTGPIAEVQKLNPDIQILEHPRSQFIEHDGPGRNIDNVKVIVFKKAE